MKWTVKDVAVYLQEKEYVDTAVIPLVPLALEKNVKSIVSGGEFVQMIVSELERQFKGRVFLFPPFTYFVSESMEEKMKRITDWTSELTANGMKHIFYVTSDTEWKAREADLPGALLWLPSLPLEHMDEKYKQQIVTDQTSQLMNLLVAKWS
ncbi:YpiF family protein [Bacillus alveayuensis]|uniref:YpiF family protein n=1 Tax=Aeribacillus alveayuensis TaxID=279215 RepID=UPI0005CDAAF9|nr:YpiF family protein [Bacillus alveayuensis]